MRKMFKKMFMQISDSSPPLQENEQMRKNDKIPAREEKYWTITRSDFQVQV